LFLQDNEIILLFFIFYIVTTFFFQTFKKHPIPLGSRCLRSQKPNPQAASCDWAERVQTYHQRRRKVIKLKKIRTTIIMIAMEMMATILLSRKAVRWTLVEIVTQAIWSLPLALNKD
jgi:hypothetical protein